MLQSILWLLLAAIHFFPALAFFQPVGLTRLYRIQPDNPLFLLMQHRAGLFLAVFAVCVYAAFMADGRRAATIVVAISMLSFLFLWVSAGSPPALRRIALVDLAGVPILLAAAWFAWKT